jgi:hypothetical protein
MANSSAPMTCHYMFPCHPAKMYEDTPSKMKNNTRMLRVEMITMIAQLSQQFSQEDLDTKIFVDIKNNDITGLDMAELFGMSGMNLCVGNQRIPLGQLTATNWKTMRVN